MNLINRLARLESALDKRRVEAPKFRPAPLGESQLDAESRLDEWARASLDDPDPRLRAWARSRLNICDDVPQVWDLGADMSEPPDDPA